MESLHLTLCQCSLVWESPETNRRNIELLLCKEVVEQTDLILLPEMFTTGFSMHSDKLAESMDGPTVSWMQAMADRFGAAIAGSLIICDGGRYFNRLVFVRPGNPAIDTYDKRHRFTLAGEHEHFDAGTRRCINSWKSWNIAWYICYDLRFPVWSRNVEAADLMVYVANFPAKRARAWNGLLPARAIENQCYVAGVNRTGTDGKGLEYQGDSAVYDFEGRPLLHMAAREGLQTICLSHPELENFRNEFPFLRDRDAFGGIT